MTKNPQHVSNISNAILEHLFLDKHLACLQAAVILASRGKRQVKVLSVRFHWTLTIIVFISLLNSSVAERLSCSTISPYGNNLNS